MSNNQYPAVSRGGHENTPGAYALTHKEVENMRLEYAAARAAAWAATDADGWELATQTEKAIAPRYGVAPSTVRRVVLGLSYKDAPGPIDYARRGAHDTLERDKKVYGATVAAQRARAGDRPGLAGVATVEVTITRPDGTVTRISLPAGSTVQVTTQTT